MSTLKAELKEWEAHFRAQNGGRDPSKADIKADAAIAAKYKQYAHSKAPSSKVPTKPSAVPSPASAPQPQPSIFKTPTKPKPPRFDPSQASTTERTKPASQSPPKPTYVVANSPSKLRALAAAHSSYSPNSAAARPGSASRGNAAAMAGGGITVVGSPKKYNPFAAGLSSDDAVMGSRSRSPKKVGRNLFADDLMDVDERAKDAARQRFGTDGGRGASIFARSSSASAASHGRGNGVSAGARSDVEMDSVTDDEAIGPSPVKPSARGKSYKPLFEDDPEPAPKQTSKPKPFQGDISHLREAPKPKLVASTSGLASKKRTGASLFDLDQPLKKSSTAPNESQDDAWTGDGEDAPSKGKKGKKGKGAAKPRAPPKGKSKPTKFSAPAVAQTDEEIELDEEGVETKASVQRRSERNRRVLDLDDSDDDGDDEEDTDAGDADEREAAGEAPPSKKERVVVHPIRPYFRRDQDDDGAEDARSAPGSLFYRDNADLLSSSQPVLQSQGEPAVTMGETLVDDLDADLAAMLELRSSPNKKTALLREKGRDMRIKKLLDEPSLHKPRKGLADLEDEGGSDDGAVAVEGGSDDDWASDADGWKDLGDGEMDEYDDEVW